MAQVTEEDIIGENKAHRSADNITKFMPERSFFYAANCKRLVNEGSDANFVTVQKGDLEAICADSKQSKALQVTRTAFQSSRHASRIAFVTKSVIKKVNSNKAVADWPPAGQPREARSMSCIQALRFSRKEGFTGLPHLKLGFLLQRGLVFMNKASNDVWVSFHFTLTAGWWFRVTKIEDFELSTGGTFLEFVIIILSRLSSMPAL